jgi:hypothetical protein
MFVDVSHCIAVNAPARCGGVSVVDLDHDGISEFFVCGADGPNRILKWVNGALRDITPVPLMDASRRSLAAIAADIDGDGHDELYVVNSDQPGDRLWCQTAGGFWIDHFDQPGDRELRNTHGGHALAAIDRRGTGRASVLVVHRDQPARFYERNPDGTLIDLADPLGFQAIRGPAAICVAPVASDRPDVTVMSTAGDNLLFRNTGIGVFAETAREHGLADAREQSLCVAAVDLDGDGRLDLAWLNRDGPHRLMHRQARGDYRNRATPAFALPSMAVAILAADFDNDGCEELLCLNDDGPNRLVRIDDDTVRIIAAGAATECAGRIAGTAVADIDGDGLLEVLIAFADESPLQLLKPISRQHRWVRIDVRSRFGAPARGAVVTARICDRVRIRCPGSVPSSEAVAHFGLRSATMAHEVIVTWPDAASVVIPRVSSNTTRVVRYPE